MLMKKSMNSKQIGNLTEMKTMISFMELGFNVLTPYGDCERYDFVVDIKGHLYKVQSKTSSSQDEGASFSFSCTSCNRKAGAIVHHKYSEEDIDFFATLFNNQCYLIPVSECGNRKILRLLPTKNGQTRGVTWAKNYELEEVVKSL